MPTVVPSWSNCVMLTIDRCFLLSEMLTGQLDQGQFFKCMYLMDGMRRGAQLPAVLPPGLWPQVWTVIAGISAMT